MSKISDKAFSVNKRCVMTKLRKKSGNPFTSSRYEFSQYDYQDRVMEKNAIMQKSKKCNLLYLIP